MAYGIYWIVAASKRSKFVSKIFVSTDCPIITQVSKKYGAIHIKRPKNLLTSKALGENVYVHGYYEIKKILNLNSKDIEFIILLMANAPTINNKLINKGIKILRENKVKREKDTEIQKENDALKNENYKEKRRQNFTIENNDKMQAAKINPYRPIHRGEIKN